MHVEVLTGGSARTKLLDCVVMVTSSNDQRAPVLLLLATVQCVCAVPYVMCLKIVA